MAGSSMQGTPRARDDMPAVPDPPTPTTPTIQRKVDTSLFSEVDMLVKVPALVGSIYTVLEAGDVPIPRSQRLPECDCYLETPVHGGLTLFQDLCDSFLEVTNGKPPTALMMRRMFRPYLTKLGGPVREQDIDSIYKVFQMNTNDVKMRSEHKSYFDFIRFVHVVVSKAVPKKPLDEAMEIFGVLLSEGLKPYREMQRHQRLLEQQQREAASKKANGRFQALHNGGGTVM